MASYSLQMKAMLLIAMLAGNEAKRISDLADIMTIALNASSPGDEDKDYTRAEPEETYKALNRECTWSFGQGCEGYGCAKRSLTLDWPPPSSQSCRHTDDWMMNNNGVANFKTVVGVLHAKSVKYASKCDESSFSFLNLYCTRRRQQMMRAMKFISKAQANPALIDAMSDEEKAEQQQQFEASLENVAGTMGENGNLILSYAGKLKDDPGFKKDPIRGVQSLMQLIMKLEQGSSEEKQAAREEIERFEASPPLSESEEQKASESNARLASSFSKDETDAAIELLDEYDNLVPDNAGDITENATTPIQGSPNALVQVRSEVVGVALTIALVVLLVVASVAAMYVAVLTLIVTWYIVAILTCGITLFWSPKDLNLCIDRAFPKKLRKVLKMMLPELPGPLDD